MSSNVVDVVTDETTEAPEPTVPDANRFSLVLVAEGVVTTTDAEGQN